MPAPSKGTAPLDWAGCPSLANWRRHYRLGEKPCRACREFWNAYARQTRADRNEGRKQARDRHQ